MEAREPIDEIDVQKYWLVLRRRWFPSILLFSAVFATAVVYALHQKPVYRAESTLLFKANRSPSLTGVGEGLGELEVLQNQNSPLDTQAEIVRSLPVAEEALKILKLRDPETGEPIKPDQLARELEIKDVPGTDVLRIGYEADDPELAAKVVNTITQVYLHNNVQSNRSEAAAAREFIQQQLPQTEEAVRRADSDLRQFKEQNNVIVLDDEAKAAVQIITDLQSQIAEAQAQLADASARSRGLSDRIGLDAQQGVVAASLSQAPAVQSVLTQLQQTQQQLAVERTRYRSGYPSITNLERQVDALNALLQERISQVIRSNAAMPLADLQLGDVQQTVITDLVRTEAERLGLQQRITILSRTLTAYQQRSTVLPRLEQTQRELERKLQASQTTYENLLTRLQEIQVAENQNVGNARVISPALVPEQPSGSDTKLVIAAGGMVGMLLAIATAFAIDLIDQSIKTVKESRETLGYTLLGIIPNHTRLSRSRSTNRTDNPAPLVVVRDLPRSPLSEAYQMLQANLRFLNTDTVLKTIAITSSVAKEGKSEVCANLAMAIAQVNRRVLLVDADMRRPAQHHIWSQTNFTGLSNVIVNQASFDDVVQEITPTLHLLTSGVIPPNPVALLDSNRMASLVQEFSQRYDFVIFDTPPLSGTADAAVLGKMVDGVLLVVRPGVVTFANANTAKEFLTQSHQHILGMVVNAVDVNHEPDSYFYYTQDPVATHLPSFGTLADPQGLPSVSDRDPSST